MMSRVSVSHAGKLLARRCHSVAFVEVSGLGPFPYRWVSHAQYEMLLHSGHVFQGLKIEINKVSLNDWYACLYM